MSLHVVEFVHVLRADVISWCRLQMSRRKQSNPKPLKHQEDLDEVPAPGVAVQEKEAMKEALIRSDCGSTAADSDRHSENSSTEKPESPPIAPSPAAGPPDPDAGSSPPPVIKSESLPSSSATPPSANTLEVTTVAAPTFMVVSPTQTARGMVCSCGISFSSLSTFSAHQKFYCTNRNSPTLTKDRILNSAEDSVASRCSPESDDRPASYPHTTHSPDKSTFSCSQCAFVTDKCSSLTKHRRIHSPVQSTSAERDRVDERFCSSCDIQFSSLKTFLVHKQHYCQTRLGKNPASGAMDPANSEQEPNEHLFILPTDPPILVSLKAIQNATLAPSALQIQRSLHKRMSPHVILPDGTLRPLNNIIERDEVSVNSSKPEIHQTTNTSPSAFLNTVGLPFHRIDPKISYQFPWSNKEATTEPSQEKPLDLTRKRKQSNVPASAATKKKYRSNSHDNDSPPSSSVDVTDKRSKSNSFSGEKSEHSDNISSGTTPRICVKPLSSIMELPADANKQTADHPLHVVNPTIDLPASMWKALASADRSISIPTMAALMNNGSLRGALSTWSPVLGQSTTIDRNGLIHCADCGVAFQKRESYLVHRASYCSGRESTSERTSPKEEKSSTSINAQERRSSPSNTPPQQLKYSCRMCKTKFMSQDTLNAHQSFYCSAVYKNVGEASSSSEIPARVSESIKSDDLGWKCPCCAVISGTAMSAQKHLETHNNVRAFKCSMCGYKGNTLRGMRTHIRMHFSEKKTVDMSEESFISCIVANSDDEDLLGSRDSKNEKCPLCPFKSSNPESMVKHYTLAHPATPGLNNSFHSDLDMSERLSSSMAANSLRVSEKCPLCSFYTDVPEIMTQHQALRHGRIIDVDGNETSLKSAILPKGNNIVASPSKYIEGVPVQQQEEGRTSSHGSSSTTQSTSDSPDAAKSSDIRSQRSIRCNHCDISFKQSASFEAHMQFYCPGRIASANRSLTPVQ